MKALIFKILTFVAINGVDGHICLHSPKPVASTDLMSCGPTFSQCQADPSGEPVATWAPGSTVTIQWRRPGGNREGRGEPAGQARHGGGITEFGLRYDGGKFKALGRCARNCPDVGMDFTLKLPADLPLGNAVFTWNWSPAQAGQPELYSNCSVVRIEGSPAGPGSGLSWANACDVFDRILGFQAPPDGHGNNPGDGYNDAIVNYEGCPGGSGIFDEGRWETFFQNAASGTPSPAPGPAPGPGPAPEPEPVPEEPQPEVPPVPDTPQPKLPPVPENPPPEQPVTPEVPAEDDDDEDDDDEAPRQPRDPSTPPSDPSTPPSDPSSPPADNPAPKPQPQPIGDCDATVTNLCDTSKPNMYYYCIWGKLLELPLHGGLVCKCRDEAASGMCPMSHVARA